MVEVGGGVRTYRVAGRDVLDGYAETDLAPGSAGQILMPWPNRIRDGRYVFDGESHQLALTEPAAHNAIHGLTVWSAWHRVSGDDASVTLEHTLPARPGYPWTLLLTTTWSVGPDGLRATHTATNLSGGRAPFGMGAHPYLSVPGVDDTVLSLPARSRLLVDGRKLPIGAARVTGSDYDFTTARTIGSAVLDTAFGDVPAGGSRAVLSTGDGGELASVWADEAFRWWQVFTGDTLPAPRTRRSVAVEPMTCPPDAFSSGRDLIIIEPGETWRGSWGLRPGPGLAAAVAAPAAGGADQPAVGRP